MLKSKQLIRYEKHIDLPSFGEENQLKLLNKTVVIVGAGGLGCPVSLYLAASGIGKIILVDDDTVSLTNLQRQILYKTSDQKQNKVDVACDSLVKLNEDCIVVPVAERIDEGNVDQFVKNCDLVIDATDNFDTRYLLNEYANKNAKTLISGSVLHYNGQVSVFKPGTACYQCLYPEKPKPHEVPSCSDSSVLSPLVGVIGTMMAVEAIKELTGVGQSIAGNIIFYDALTGHTNSIEIAKNPNCAICASKD